MAGETPQMKNTLQSAEKRSNSSIEVVEGWPHYDGVPMVKLSCAASELINTGNYSNVTVGPVQVTAFATAKGELLFDGAALAQAINGIQKLCEEACAEERETVQVLLRSNASRASQ